MAKQNPHTTELYKLRFQNMYNLWERVYGTPPSVGEIQILDRAKSNKKQYETIVSRLETLLKSLRK